MDAVDGTHHLGGVHLGHGGTFRVELPQRGHGMAWHPARPDTVVVVERRPGWQFHVVNLRTGEVEHRVAARPGRHFFGHVTWDGAGRHLYTTENVYDETGADLTPRDSVVGVYDAAAAFAPVGELPAHGVGAHELKMMPDGRTLVVAVGGLYTHPELPREDLNVETMAPSLVFLDAVTGALLARHLPPDHFSSVRHVDITAAGRVVVGLQGQDPQADTEPLLMVATRDGWEPLVLPPNETRALQQYTSGVAVHPTREVMLAASPRGNRAVVLDAAGNHLATVAETNPAGTATLGDHLLVSCGTGALLIIDENGAVADRRMMPDTLWDNHLIAIPG